MVSTSTIATVDLVLGTVATLGLLYLLYSGSVVVQYRRFFRIVTAGLLVYAVTGPVVGTVTPAYIHAVHGTAVLIISIGLYDLIREDIQRDRGFELLRGDYPGTDGEFPDEE